MADEKVSVRYMVDDVDKAVNFYTGKFGFEPGHTRSAAFAEVIRGNLRLLLAGPESSAGRPMPDGRKPEPGGWNRIHFIVDDIAAEVERLRTVFTSATTSSAAPAASRSWSTTHPGIPSRSSSLRADEPASAGSVRRRGGAGPVRAPWHQDRPPDRFGQEIRRGADRQIGARAHSGRGATRARTSRA
jgi:hypothetical protein